MLPSAYNINTSGSQTMPCQRSGAVRWRCCQKNSSAVPSTPNAAMADFRLSCSINSLGTPTAGISSIIRASITTGRSDWLFGRGATSDEEGIAADVVIVGHYHCPYPVRRPRLLHLMGSDDSKTLINQR